MKHQSKQRHPQGWNRKKVQEVITHYDLQSEDEAAEEIASAPEAAGEAWMSVSTELIQAVARLIEKHERGEGRRSRSSLKKS